MYTKKDGEEIHFLTIPKDSAQVDSTPGSPYLKNGGLTETSEIRSKLDDSTIKGAVRQHFVEQVASGDRYAQNVLESIDGTSKSKLPAKSKPRNPTTAKGSVSTQTAQLPIVSLRRASVLAPLNNCKPADTSSKDGRRNTICW